MRSHRRPAGSLSVVGLVGALAAGCVGQAVVSAPSRSSIVATTISIEPSQTTPYSSVAQMLVGRVAGLQLVQSANGRSSLRIRGGQEVLLVLDGTPIPGDADAVLATLSPRDVRRVEVIRDAGAAALYSRSRGWNAVILITTTLSPRGN